MEQECLITKPNGRSAHLTLFYSAQLTAQNWLHLSPDIGGFQL